VNGTVSGLSGGVAYAVTSGGKVDYESIAADAFGNALGNSFVDGMSPKPLASSQAGARPEEELREVGITARYVGPGSEERNARLNNNPINVIGSGSDGMQSASTVVGEWSTTPSGAEEFVISAPRLTVPQEQLYDRLIAPIWQFGYGMPESAAMSYVDRVRENDIRYDNNVTAENNRVAINFGLTMVGGGAAGAFGAALFPAFLASTDSVLLAGAASGATGDLAFQGYQNALFAGSEGSYGRSGFDVTEFALSAGFGAVPGLPRAIRGWASDLRGLGVPDWKIGLSRPGTLYSNGTGLELERIGSTVGNTSGVGAAGRQFVTSDPGVGDIIAAIEARAPGAVKQAEINVYRPDGTTYTDFDIVTDTHVIQVKVGGGKGIVPQIQTSQQLTDLPVIGFDANGIVGTGQSFKPSVMKNAQQNGITIVNNIDDLMNILRPGGK